MSEEMEDEKSLVGVRTLFERLGASAEQAETMANQLLKRADQIAKERGISKVEATEMLLKKVVEARQGV